MCGAISRSATSRASAPTSRCSGVGSKSPDDDEVVSVPPPPQSSSIDFDQDRVALAAAAADRGDPVAAAAAAQLVDDRRRDACAGRTDWMAERNRAAQPTRPPGWT